MSTTESTGVILGVTGHRVLAEQDKISAGVAAGLDRVEAAYPGRPLVLLSPLAEGADRLVATEVLKRTNGRLRVPLPLPLADYMSDFPSPESQIEFKDLLGRADQVFSMAPRETRNAAYEAVGHYVVDHAQVVIAVWDGEGAQGQGGTGAIVARARSQGKPIVIVRAGNRRPGTSEPTTLGPEQGRLITERI